MLLTDKRGMYELARGRLDEATLCLETMARFANASGMLPEQVWEETGKGTGSAPSLSGLTQNTSFCLSQL